MVRAGKSGKGFTPQVADQCQVEDVPNDDLLYKIVRKVRERWSAIAIQRAWKAKRQREAALAPQWEETGATQHQRCTFRIALPSKAAARNVSLCVTVDGTTNAL